jgi:hypothetical protein
MEARGRISSSRLTVGSAPQSRHWRSSAQLPLTLLSSRWRGGCQLKIEAALHAFDRSIDPDFATGG